MNNGSLTGNTPTLKKVLGLSSLFVVAVGNVTTQSSFVSILNGMGAGGASFFVAILMASLLSLCYVYTFAELSLMMPKAGGPGTYTTVAIGHFPAIVLVLCGYIISAAFTIPSELMLLKRVFADIFPNIYSHIDLLMLAAFTILNILGIDIFASIQNFIVYVMIISVFVIGFAGFNPAGANGADSVTMWHQIAGTNSSVFSLTLLALWSFAGLEFVCPLIEESKRPEKDIPKALLYGLLMLVGLYSVIAYAGIRQLSAADLQSEVPHWLLVQSLFGNAAKIVIVVFVITACSSTVNIIVATTPRVLYGMAHHKQLPDFFKKIHSRWDTPWLGILFFSGISAIPLIAWGNEPGFILVMIISAATVWLVAYIISHINLMILRKRYPHFKRPFKTPFYPLPQIIGIAGMSYALWNNSPSETTTAKVYTYAGIYAGIAIVYAFFWVKYKMKKGLFEAVPIEQAIAD